MRKRDSKRRRRARWKLGRWVPRWAWEEHMIGWEIHIRAADIERDAMRQFARLASPDGKQADGGAHS